MPQPVASDPLAALHSRPGQGRSVQANKADSALAMFAEALSARLRGAQPDEAGPAGAPSAPMEGETNTGQAGAAGEEATLDAMLAHMQGAAPKKLVPHGATSSDAIALHILPPASAADARKSEAGDGETGRVKAVQATTDRDESGPVLSRGGLPAALAAIAQTTAKPDALDSASPPGLALGHMLGRAVGRATDEEGGEAGPPRMDGAPLAKLLGDASRSARGRILPAGAAEVAATASARRAGGEVGRGLTAQLEVGNAPRSIAESLPTSLTERAVLGEWARSPTSLDRMPGLPPGAESSSLLAGVNTRLMPGDGTLPGRVTVPLTTPFGQAQWGTELGEKLVWLAGRQGHVAELQLSPPSLGSLEIRLSLNGNEAGAQFYSANAAVREAIEAALPRLREMLANSGLTLGGASVSSESFQSAASFARDGQGRGEGGDKDTARFGAPEVAPWRVAHGLVDLYA